MNKKNKLSRNNKIIHSLIKKEILKIKDNYLDNHSLLIEALKIVQKYYGWVSDDSIFFLSKFLNISISDIESIATFYSQIFRSPVGNHVIKFCDSVVCYITGFKEIKNILEKKLKIKCGETTKDKNFTLLPICCLGACDRGPVMMINNNTYFSLTKDSVIKLLDSLK